MFAMDNNEIVQSNEKKILIGSVGTGICNIIPIYSWSKAIDGLVDNVVNFRFTGQRFKP
jgi:hypothetical protein